MDVQVHILNAGKTLTPFLKELQEISADAISRALAVLPIKNVDLILYDNPDAVIEHIGICGYTPNANLVYISLDPRSREFAKNIHDHLGRQIAHELHHTLRWIDPGYGTTLLEALISEGLADHFSYEVFPGELEQWDTALTNEQLQTFRTLAEEQFDKPYNHNEWFFGSHQIPRWTGYTLGFQLVSAYSKNDSNTSAMTLYNKQASEFRGR